MMMSRCFIVSFRGWLWFYLFPIHKHYYDVSVFIPVSNVPRTTISELFNPFSSIMESECPLTIHFSILEFSNILMIFPFTFPKSQCSLTIPFPIFPLPFILVPISISSCSLTMWFPRYYFPQILVSI